MNTRDLAQIIHVHVDYTYMHTFIKSEASKIYKYFNYLVQLGIKHWQLPFN